MHWSTMLLVACAIGDGDLTQWTRTSTGMFESYTQAWHAAHEAERPMLVILNPAADESGDPIAVEDLKADERVSKLLDDCVVAVIDTGTDHGKKVHELFDNSPLPRVVVIDKEQKWQLYRTSGTVSNSRLAGALQQARDGETAAPTTVRQVEWARSYTAPSSCPNCQRGWRY